MANPYENVNAYNRNRIAAIEPTGNSRDTDARALLSCAARIDEAKRKLMAEPKSRTCLKDYNDALRQNQRLWTIFQVALTDAQNPLPDNLKLILLNLSRYVDKTSFRAIGKYTPDLADSLITINRTIAAGLSKPAPQNAQGTQQTAPPPSARPEVATSLTTSA